MSKKGGSNHLNRMASPRYMRVDKKMSKYIANNNQADGAVGEVTISWN